jgi:N-acetylglutamate synthase-like GNAT family acetyltransferase
LFHIVNNLQVKTMAFRIQFFEPKYQSEVESLIEQIQVGEFSIFINDSQRKELRSIPESFQKDKGNYWVALFNERVIGTIAVIDIGHNAFELRDVFLHKDYHGKGTGYAKQLLDTIFAWCQEHEVRVIFLGTTLKFVAAHRFYEKNGFVEISRSEMPPYCKPMDCDEKFYRFDFEA